jgi:hypothetical protein
LINPEIVQNSKKKREITCSSVVLTNDGDEDNKMENDAE